jgi:flagellar hook-length control protein FliK
MPAEGTATAASKALAEGASGLTLPPWAMARTLPGQAGYEGGAASPASQEASEIGPSMALAGKSSPSTGRAYFAHLRMLRADSNGSAAGAPGLDAGRAGQEPFPDEGRAKATGSALALSLGVGGFLPADGKPATGQAANPEFNLAAGMRSEARLGLASSAGTVTGMAEAAPPPTLTLPAADSTLPQPPGHGSPPTLARGAIAERWDSAAFAPALGVRISQFLRNGVQQAELALNPAEMGPLSLRLQLDGQTAQVHLAAERAATREALTAALPALAAAMNEAGFTLAGGGVSDQRGAGLAGERSGSSSDPGGTSNGAGNGPDRGPRDGLVRVDTESLATTLERRAQALAQARALGRGGVDLYA